MTYQMAAFRLCRWWPELLCFSGSRGALLCSRFWVVLSAVPFRFQPQYVPAVMALSAVLTELNLSLSLVLSPFTL